MNLRDRISASLLEIRASSRQLAKLHLELLAAELKAKGGRYAGALALLVGACLLALYALGFALATVALALSLVIPVWLSLLIVTIGLALAVLVLALAGRAQLRRAGTPAPEKSLAQARASADVAWGHASKSAAAVTSLFARPARPTRPEGQAPPNRPRWPVRPQTSPAPRSWGGGAAREEVSATPSSSRTEGQP